MNFKPKLLCQPWLWNLLPCNSAKLSAWRGSLGLYFTFAESSWHRKEVLVLMHSIGEPTTTHICSGSPDCIPDRMSWFMCNLFWQQSHDNSITSVTTKLIVLAPLLVWLACQAWTWNLLPCTSAIITRSLLNYMAIMDLLTLFSLLLNIFGMREGY